MDREKKLEYALLLMVYQYCTEKDYMYHSFMTAGETAFDVLGIDNFAPTSKIEFRISELESEGY